MCGTRTGAGGLGMGEYSLTVIHLGCETEE